MTQNIAPKTGNHRAGSQHPVGGVMALTPGPTLADAKGTRRLRKLKESRDNLMAIIAEKQENVRIIEHEIEQLERDTI